ncbi:MAG: proprotein convertase P-domain-containing protein [Ferruginibacter sp.]
MRKIITIFILIASSVTVKSQTFTWTGNQPIFDNQIDTIPIFVSGIAAAIDTNYGIAHICLNITHSYDDDLFIKLVSPTGSSVVLIQAVGGSGNNFIGTCLGMDGTAFTNALPPYSGLFFPAGNVSAFNNGQNPNGTWLLIVEDIASPDTGTIHSGSIEFTNNPPRLIASSGSGAPVGNYLCASCICPGGASNCDLLPDMTSSYKEIFQNHLEEPGFLYISNATPNIGYGPIDIYGIDSCFCGTTHVPCGTICPGGEPIKHMVKQRIYQKVSGKDTLSYYDRIAGKMTFHPQHGHLHVDNWASYSLRTATSNPDARTWPIVATGTKQSFCLINLGTCAGNPGECVDNNGNTLLTAPNNNLGFHSGCGLNQGIYPGNYDVYSISLNDPIPLENVCNGNYYIVSITDPDNDFLESNEENNWIAVPITLTQQNPQPTISANGSIVLCAGGTVTLTSSPQANYLWSTGATTQSIVVSAAGTFTVSYSCGTSTITSTPKTVSMLPANSTAGVSIAITAGGNPTCPGIVHVFNATGSNGGDAPVFQWKINGVNVGSNSNTYTTSSLTNGQVVTCVMTSNISCLSATPANSNSITMTVNPAVDPTVAIALTTGTNPQCPGSTATFTAAVSNGISPLYQWKVNNVNVGSNSNTFTSLNLTNGQTVRCDIIATETCADKATLGTGTALNDIRSDSGAAYPTYYGNGRQQYLVKASELIALGFSAGTISSLGFNVAGAVGDPSTLNGYRIQIGNTAATFLTNTFLTPSFTTVYGPSNYTPVTNSLNTHLFTTPFSWNGTSNIVIDICFSNQVYGTIAYQTFQTGTNFVSTAYYQADNAAGAGACSVSSGSKTGSVRPNMVFTVDELKNAVSNTITMAVNQSNTYTFTGSGNWNIASNWTNNIIPPAVLPSCSEIFIDPPLGQECLLNITQTISPGAKITVKTNKLFRIPGNLLIQ